MEQLPLSFLELLRIVSYFSSLVLLVGIVFQFLIIIRQDQRISPRLFFVILLTQMLVLSATIYLWLKWPMGLKILYGPILFPAVVSEILIIPVVFNFFNYRIFSKRKVDV